VSQHFRFGLLHLGDGTEGLGVKQRTDCDYRFSHLQLLNQEFAKTILIVEQKVREVLEICDHVYAIKLGRIVYSGPPGNTEKYRQP
jgi:ABC-type branched-subunit amino acid transport system ATPase component